MIRYLLLGILFLLFNRSSAQLKNTSEKNLRPDWLIFENNQYKTLGSKTTSIHTIYIKIEADRYPDCYLTVRSAKSYFLFINGKIAGEFHGEKRFKLDSLTEIHYTPSFLIGINQQNINPLDLQTTIELRQYQATTLEDIAKPSTYFKDFVILSGLIVIILFLITTRLNPKLTSDYFSVTKIFSLREGDDAQSNARLTNSSNIAFYIICSLLLGFYLIIIINHLPDQYALPFHFQGDTFWSTAWQWVRLSSVVLIIFFIKILLVFSLTRLFGLNGLARIHFFNWVRLILIVFGTASIIVFTYFILRGNSPNFFVIFLVLIVVTLTAWTFLVFLKLNNKTEHSMFHLFSYICATEIIPLLITIKVLFQ